MNPRASTRSLLALAVTVTLWASAFPAIRVGLTGLGVAGLSFLRLAVASLALALVAPLIKVRRPSRRDLPLIAVCGVTGMSAYQLLLNWGEVHVAAGTASLLIAIAPVFSVLLGGAFLGERLARNTLLGSGIAIAGAAVISLTSAAGRLSAAAMVVLAAAVVQGVYHFATKPLLGRHTGLEVACYAIWTGTLFLLPLAPSTLRDLPATPASAIGSAVYLGLLPSALGFVVWGYAVARLPLAVSTAALYLVPPVAILVAFVWLGEIPRPAEPVGGLITVAGVVLINRRRRSPEGRPTGRNNEPFSPVLTSAEGLVLPAGRATADRARPTEPGSTPPKRHCWVTQMGRWITMSRTRPIGTANHVHQRRDFGRSAATTDWVSTALPDEAGMSIPLQQPSPQAVDDRSHQHDHRWLILVIIATAQLMVVLDATIVNIALPSAQHALGFADNQRQWIVTAYALAFGSLLLLGGRIGDLFGRKWAFIGGLLGFALASAAGGAAQSFGVLVTSRALQGVFGAILAPAALSTLANAFQDPRERGRAFGVFGAVAGGGGAVGLLLGGALTEWASWRWCFYVNLVFAAVATIGGLIYLRNEANPQRPRLDLIGSATAGAGLFGLVFGFSRAEGDGWTDPGTIISLVAGVVLLAGFVLIEQRVAHPLLPLRIVLDRNRGGAYLAVGAAAIAIFGVFLFLTYYLQLVKGFTPVQTGLAFLPMILFVLFSSTLANVRLLPIVGARLLISTGMLLGGMAMFYLSRITPEASYATHVLPALPVLGLGFGLIFAPAINTATAGVARTDAGVASAMVNTMQQVGGSVGTALLSTIAAGATASYVKSHGAAAALNGAVHGYTVAFLVSGSIFILGALTVFSLIQPHVRPNERAAAPADETLPVPHAVAG